MNLNVMSREEILDWIIEQQESMSEAEFEKFFKENGKAIANRLEQLDRMEDRVLDLFNEVSDFDDGVANFFDIESDKMLGKKIRVLQELRDGKSPEEIGKDYLDILEGLDKSEMSDGKIIEVGGWEFDPLKYK